MSRLIDADALIDELNNRIDAAIKWGVNAIADRDAEIKLRAEQAVATFCEASLTVKKMPTIYPKTGRWIHVKKRLLRGGYVDASECSSCHKRIMPHLKPHYCPNCGARMVEGEEDG